MDRLTIKAPSGLIHLKDNSEMILNEAIRKLAEYEDLEEQGKLLKLPCAVGDTVYETFDGEVLNRIVRGILFRDGKILSQDGNGSIFGEFGKTVFLTWEEAEATLKELHETAE